jgi:polyhydroxybutyrate depolymerase
VRRWTAGLAGLVAIAVLCGCRPFPARDAAGDDPAASGAASALASAPPSGSSADSITVDGVQRTYRLYRPATLSPTAPAPLVVMLHGGYGSGSQAEQSYGWDAEADRYGFVVAYPDGLDRAWNAGGGCCGVPARTGVDDVGFVVGLVAELRSRLPIDPRRVYATGISNGGMLSYRLACDTRLFAAIGPDSATLLGPCPAAAPVSVIHVHGTADRNIPYLGGQGQGVAKIDGPAVPAVIAQWRATDRCTAPSTGTAGPLTTSIATCPGGRAVELITILGAGHQWPGSPPRTAVQTLLGLDPPSTALNATDTIWHFFAAHPAPGTAG